MLTWGLCQPSWCTDTQYGYRESGTCGTTERVVTCRDNVGELHWVKDAVHFMYELYAPHLQSGFVGGCVVGQPTTVSQALHHLEAVRRYISYLQSSRR